jgi:hypothetical protein
MPTTDEVLFNAKSLIALARKREKEASNTLGFFSIISLSMLIFQLMITGIVVWLMREYSIYIFSSTQDLWEVILGATLWGILGSVLYVLSDLRIRVNHQQLDPERLLGYFIHPLTGAGLGTILVLAIHGGLLIFTVNSGNYQSIPIYALAALAGLNQSPIIRLLNDTMKNILHIQESKDIEKIPPALIQSGR